ncbi:MAG: FAD-dependent oxidoreductase, partial [Deltaproteobacteria bacterium]|nr:FAD-dependent oxidoreductase [Deltaproteobacteria bacterium]
MSELEVEGEAAVGIGYIRSDLVTLSQIHGDKCWPTVDKVSPCEEVCPIHMDIPSYVMALAQGQFKEAIEVVRETNPFPSICGRVCHHPCEEACNRTLVDGPIAIEFLKRFVGEYEKATNGLPEPVERTKEERVAIIGSGPAGLTAAYDLVKEGYGVNVYEALPVAGGMLAAGIPEFILPMKTVKAEVDHIKALGVKIKTNIRIGKDLTIEELQNQGFKVILLATGAWKSAELQIPGVELKGVTQALDLLRDAKLGEKIVLKGTVVVIGGGNVAVDAARTAIRLGAEKVILTCLESRAEMPAFEWEIETAEKEGIEIMPSLAPRQINSRPVKRVGSIDFKKVASTSRDENGRMSWTLDEGPDSDVMLEASTVIVAIGQVPDPSFAEKVNVDGAGSF